jgi:hypothetical protein
VVVAGGNVARVVVGGAVVGGTVVGAMVFGGCVSGGCVTTGAGPGSLVAVVLGTVASGLVANGVSVFGLPPEATVAPTMAPIAIATAAIAAYGHRRGVVAGTGSASPEPGGAPIG